MQLFILAFVSAALCCIEKLALDYNFLYTILQTPLILGTLIGLSVGRPIEGMILAASIQLVYIGVMVQPGNNVPSDAVLAACCAVPIALQTGMDVSSATVLAVPLGLLGAFLITLRKTICIRFMHSADKYAEEADEKGIFRVAFLYPLLLNIIFAFLPVFVAVMFGSRIIESILNVIPAFIMDGLTVAGGLLPAVGFASLLHLINRGRYLPFMLLAFFVVQLTSFSSIIMAIIGVCLAFICVALKNEAKHEINMLEGGDD